MTLWCTISWLLSWHHVTNNNSITLKIRVLNHLLPLQSPHVDVFQSCCNNCRSGWGDVSSSFFLFPSLYPLVHPSSRNLFKCCGARMDLSSNNIYFTTYSFFFSWCPHFIMQLAEKPHQCYFIVLVIPKAHDHEWPMPVNSRKWRALICGPHFLPAISQHNTCNKCSWHPPLIPWSVLLSHMSKTLKTCYPLSCGWRNTFLGANVHPF